MKKTFGLLIALFAIAAQPAVAQDVTISPQTGKLLSGLTGSGEQGFQSGFQSLWQHDQLPLTLITADDTDLTTGGTPKTHACNLKIVNGKIIIVAMSPDERGYFTISLPNGYRITSYDITFKANLVGKGVATTGAEISHRKNWTIGETNRGYSEFINSVRVPNESETTVYQLQRTSQSATDMGNTLYFEIHGEAAGSLAAIEIQNITIEFSSEGNYVASVAPTSTSSWVSMQQSPMQTNKIVLGAIQPREKSGQTFYAYNVSSVTDASAYNLIYQENAAASGVAIANAENPGIRSNGSAYEVKANKTYYIETPTTVRINNNDAPIGYRIVGAKLNLSQPAAETYYTIMNGTRYLQSNGQWGPTETHWYQTGNYFYTEVGGTRRYLRVTSYVSWKYTTYTISTTTYDDYATELTYDDGYLRYGNNRYLNSSLQFVTSNSNRASVSRVITNPTSVKVNVYGADGTTSAGEVTISSTNTSASVDLYNLNNDAIKFAVEGDADATVLVTADLTLQALSPYVESMDVVASSDRGMTVRQKLTTTNFHVGGEKFQFYVPEGVTVGNMTFSFENLYSPYGDASYKHNDNGTATAGTKYSRYSFVKSEYYNAITPDLYANKKIAMVDTKEWNEKKIYVRLNGNKEFTFNNAADLDPNSGTTTTKYFIENPFTLEKYEEEDGGEFAVTTFNDAEVDATTKNCYIFTSDETKYNIAPTTATEHRYYAFYAANIELVRKSYVGKAKLIKVYDSTNYDNTGYATAENKSKDAKEPMYGVELACVDGDTEIEGYLLANQISDLLLNEKALKDGETDVKPHQILYVDASKLLSIIDYSSEGTDAALRTIRGGLNKNALFFLPAEMLSENVNFVTSRDGSYSAASNIELVDKQPFFSPYNIQIGSEKYAKYTREISKSYYDQAQWASIMLPYSLSLENGVHTNTEADGTSFKVLTMQKENCLGKDFSDENADQKEYAEFVVRTDLTQTKANMPYIVNVTDFVPEDKTISYVAVQHGATIEATPKQEVVIDEDNKASGTGSDGSYTFVPKASLAGTQIPRKDVTFYFARNYFHSNQILISDTLYIYPFRGYYSVPDPRAGAKLNAFYISDGTDFVPTDITTIETDDANGVNVIAGDGTITAVSADDANIAIYSISGTKTAALNLKAGQEQTVTVPAGIYVVGGSKIIVK